MWRASALFGLAASRLCPKPLAERLIEGLSTPWFRSDDVAQFMGISV
jgi:hypothetical protein